MSESGEIHDCPADGCDYSGPVDSVCGHYSGTKDGSHPGHYETVRAHLVDGGELPTPSETDTRVDTRESNPLFAGADPGDQPDPDREDDDDLELPCGHESVPDDAIDEPRIVTCETCGGSWRVEP